MQNNPQKLAEQIANLFLQNEVEREANDFVALRRSVEQIGERLAKIEDVLFADGQAQAVGSRQFAHPSQEKFEIEDGFAPGENTALTDAEKPCPFEPAGKPCDRCSMCDSRGF